MSMMHRVFRLFTAITFMILMQSLIHLVFTAVAANGMILALSLLYTVQQLPTVWGMNMTTHSLPSCFSPC